jgi:hypothetical protein
MIEGHLCEEILLSLATPPPPYLEDGYVQQFK